jgi:hypothetical protein
MAKATAQNSTSTSPSRNIADPIIGLIEKARHALAEFRRAAIIEHELRAKIGELNCRPALFHLPLRFDFGRDTYFSTSLALDHDIKRLGVFIRGVLCTLSAWVIMEGSLVARVRTGRKLAPFPSACFYAKQKL